MIVNAGFNELELLTIAMAIEDQGMKFYENGANNTEGKLREFLLDAAQQEKEHKQVFQDYYNEIRNKKPEGENEYLFDHDVTSYLKAMAEKEVFDKTPSDSREAFKDLKSSVLYAVKSEALTIDIYTKMYDGAKRQDIKDLLKRLIDEEKSHLGYFKSVLKETE